MSDENRKDEKPADKPADDFIVINPPNMLAAKTQKRSGTLDDLLKNADKMLSSVQFEFEQAMDDHVRQLNNIYAQQWSVAENREAGVKAFSSIANSVKGNAGTFNYALLGKIADLFRDYLDDVKPADQKAAAILSYSNAMQVVWKQKITGDGGALCQAMIADLIKLNQKLSGPQ